MALAQPERTKTMKKMRSQGFHLQRIADQFGVSRERVRQIVGNTSERARGGTKSRVLIAGGTSKKGSMAELLVSKKLVAQGITHELMTYHHPYDILLDNGLRVEVKASSPEAHPGVTSPYYKFNTGATWKEDYTDFVVFILLDTEEVFVVPFSRLKGRAAFAFVWPKAGNRGPKLDMNEYHNRWNLLR